MSLPDQHDYELCLEGDSHIRTLVGLLYQQGIDAIVATSETQHGIPFVAMLVQGSYAQEAQAFAEGFRDAVACERDSVRRSAEEN